LAPLALVATIAGTYLIVHAGLKKHSSATSSQSAAAARAGRAHRKFARAKFYIVQPGDSLTSIAVKTGIPVTTLEALNSNIDPNSLQTAQRLRLRR
jgi:LysM repeat protein